MAKRRKKPRGCSRCGKQRHGRYSLCKKCLRLDGGIDCSKCDSVFRADEKTDLQHPKCMTCRNWKSALRNPRSTSVKTVSGGAPGLGKRR